MRLPHWLAHRWSRWATYQHDAHDNDRNLDFCEVRQWRECVTCGKRQDEKVKPGPLSGSVPLPYDPDRWKKS